MQHYRAFNLGWDQSEAAKRVTLKRKYEPELPTVPRLHDQEQRDAKKQRLASPSTGHASSASTEQVSPPKLKGVRYFLYNEHEGAAWRHAVTRQHRRKSEAGEEEPTNDDDDIPSTRETAGTFTLDMVQTPTDMPQTTQSAPQIAQRSMVKCSDVPDLHAQTTLRTSKRKLELSQHDLGGGKVKKQRTAAGVEGEDDHVPDGCFANGDDTAPGMPNAACIFAPRASDSTTHPNLAVQPEGPPAPPKPIKFLSSRTSPAAFKNSTDSPLLALPPELRNEIYAHCLHDLKTRNAPRRKMKRETKKAFSERRRIVWEGWPAVPAFLLACTQTHAEFEPMWRAARVVILGMRKHTGTTRRRFLRRVEREGLDVGAQVELVKALDKIRDSGAG